MNVSMESSWRFWDAVDETSRDEMSRILAELREYAKDGMDYGDVACGIAYRVVRVIFEIASADGLEELEGMVKSISEAKGDDHKIHKAITAALFSDGNADKFVDGISSTLSHLIREYRSGGVESMVGILRSTPPFVDFCEGVIGRTYDNLVSIYLGSFPDSSIADGDGVAQQVSEELLEELIAITEGSVANQDIRSRRIESLRDRPSDIVGYLVVVRELLLAPSLYGARNRKIAEIARRENDREIPMSSSGAMFSIFASLYAVVASYFVSVMADRDG